MFIQKGFTEADVAWKVWLVDGTVLGVPYYGPEEERESYVDVLEQYDFLQPLLVYDGLGTIESPRRIMHVINPDKILRIEILQWGK
jgi:hypothetical protein